MGGLDDLKELFRLKWFYDYLESKSLWVHDNLSAPIQLCGAGCLETSWSAIASAFDVTQKRKQSASSLSSPFLSPLLFLPSLLSSLLLPRRQSKVFLPLLPLLPAHALRLCLFSSREDTVLACFRFTLTRCCAESHPQ